MKSENKNMRSKKKNPKNMKSKKHEFHPKEHEIKNKKKHEIPLHSIDSHSIHFKPPSVMIGAKSLEGSRSHLLRQPGMFGSPCDC